MFILCFYASMFTLCPHVNVLSCAYMTNLLFIQKVKVTERKHLTPKQNVSSSLRVFVQNLLNLFTMFFNVHMRIFVLVFYMTNFLFKLHIYKVEDKVTESCSKCFSKRIFLIFKIIFTHTLCCGTKVMYLGFFQHSLQCFSSISSVKVKVIFWRKNCGS